MGVVSGGDMGLFVGVLEGRVGEVFVFKSWVFVEGVVVGDVGNGEVDSNFE